MARTVQQVRTSGYLTKAEKRAIEFASLLEENEEHMGEQAALMTTCEMLGIDYEDYAEVFMELPDGDWWEVEYLSVEKQGDTSMTTIDTAAIRKMTDDMYPNIEELYVTLDKCADEIDRLRAELAAKNALLEKAERLLDGAVLAKLKEQE